MKLAYNFISLANFPILCKKIVALLLSNVQSKFWKPNEFKLVASGFTKPQQIILSKPHEKAMKK